MPQLIGTIRSVNTSPGGIPKLPQDAVAVSRVGLHGDGRNHAKHDREFRAISLLDAELLEVEPYRPYHLLDGQLGENLTVTGLGAQGLLPGTRLRTGGGVELEVTEPRTPCYVLDAIDPRLQHEAWGRCGVMARVITEGVIRRGEPIEILGNTWEDDALPRWPHTAVILAGGKGRRMGQPKEGVRLPNGQLMLEPILAAAQAACQRVVISGACVGYTSLPEGVLQVPDLVPDQGPLGGIVSAMEAVPDSAYLVMTCDMPRLTPYTLRLLTHARQGKARFFRDDADRKLQPFPGIFNGAWLGDMQAFLAGGERSVLEFLRRVSFEKVTIPAAVTASMCNVNTPEDLAACPFPEGG